MSNENNFLVIGDNSYTYDQFSSGFSTFLNTLGVSLQANFDPRIRSIGDALTEVSTAIDVGSAVGETNIGRAAAGILFEIALSAAANSALAPLGAQAVGLFLGLGFSPAVAGALAIAGFAFIAGVGIPWFVDNFVLPLIVDPLIAFLRDPLTLDLDGDGIELISLANSTTHFDLDGNGFAERTGWVAGDDGMLVRDGNRNGRVDSVAELYGSPTQDGFAVLETYDQNHDGKIDARDAVFRDLKVWRDLNQDGVSQRGELFTLAQLGIRSISVATQEATGTNQGHGLGVTGRFTRADGTTGTATSIYFQTDGQDSVPDESGFVAVSGVDLLPQLPRSGNLHSIAWMATNDADFRADLTALVNTSSTLSAADLRAAFEALLLQWAGADAVPEGSRGAWVDAGHLAFVEAYFGNTFRMLDGSGSTLASSPQNAAAGAQIEGSFSQIVDVMLAVFLAQVPASQLAQGVDFATVINNPYFFYALLDFRGANTATNPSPTPGNLGVVLDLLTSIAPTIFGAAIDYYTKALGGLAGMQTIAFANDAAAFRAFMSEQLQDISDVTLRKIAIAVASQDARLGTDSADILVSGDGVDVSIGNQGNDFQQSGDGGDIYVYRLGDGKDWIYDTGNLASDSDQLLLQDINAGDVTFRRIGSTLVVKTADGGSITVIDFFKNWGVDSKGIDSIRFADGSIFARAQILAASVSEGTTDSDSIRDSAEDDIIRGGEGHDGISLSGGSDTLIWSKGDGWDSVTDSTHDPTAVDRLVLADVMSNEVELTRSGDTLLVRVLTTNEVLTFGNFFHRYVPGVIATNHNYNIDFIEFSNGLSWNRERIQELAFIRGDDGNNGLVDSNLDDTIMGGAGNDSIYLDNAGNDTVVWRLGDGDDYIDRDDYNRDYTKTLRFADLTVDEVRFSYHGDTLLITVLETNEVIRVVEQFGQFRNFLNPPSATYGVDFIEFEYGVKLNPVAIARKTGRDFAGIDAFNSDNSYNVISVNGGSGIWYQPSWRYLDWSIHVVLANSISQRDEFGRPSTVILDLSPLDYISSGSYAGLTRYDPSFFSIAPRNTSIDPSYQPSGGPGHEQTYELFRQFVNAGGTSNSSDQMEILEEIQAEEFTTQGSASGNLVGTIVAFYGWINTGIRFGGTNQRDLFFGCQETFRNSAGHFVGNPTLGDHVNGMGGDDTLLGNDGSDVLIGGTGNDIIDGGEHSDVLIGGEGGDNLAGDTGDDVLYGSAGTDTLNGGNGNDLLSGGQGDDTLAGGKGYDYYVYESGDGNDLIDDLWQRLSDTGDGETLYLKDMYVSDVEFMTIGNNLVITIKETHETITIINAYVSVGSVIEAYLFEDGKRLTLSQITQNLTLRGTDGRDVLRGSGWSESIIGGLGDDFLDGWDGADTFVYRSGDGNDVIGEHLLSGGNRLKFADLNPSDLYFTLIGYDLIITDRLNGQTVTVGGQNYGYGRFTPIEMFDFADGTSWTVWDVRNNLSLFGTDFADNLSGSSSGEVIAAGLGDDYIVSNGGDDVFVYAAGDGNDVIQLGSGLETLQFTNLLATDLIVTRVGYDIKVEFAAFDGGVTLQALLRPYVYQQISGFKFADGTTWSMAEVEYWYTQGSRYFAGGGGNDTIVGSYLNQTLDGAGGADFIDGKGGSDQLNGDTGDDALSISIAGEADIDTLNGGDGVDTATFADFGYAVHVDLVTDGGSALTSRLEWVENGSTSRIGTLISIENIIGSAFNDRLFGSAEANRINAGNGNDRIEARSGNDIIYGGNGNDKIFGDLGNDTIYGEIGKDTLDGGLGNDVMIGGDGDDIYVLDVPSDVVTESVSGGIDTVRASFSYVLGADLENLTLTGSAVINGTGNALNNIISGNTANNLLFGGDGNDTLLGGDGADNFYGGIGADIHNGGDDAGIDYARYDDANYGNLTIRLGMPSSNTGAAAGDTYIGIEGVVSGIGDDYIGGDVFNNYLFGGDGNDRIAGSLGNDYLNGGAGADKFIFHTTPDSTSNVDIIADFTHLVDDVHLSLSIFSSIGTVLDASELCQGTAAADANDFVIYDRATGQLYYDANGNGVGGQTLFAILAAGTVLDVNDFVLA